MRSTRCHDQRLVTVPVSVIARLDQFRHRINVSAVCAEALDARLRELEAEQTTEEWSFKAKQYAAARGTDMLRLGGEWAFPPEVVRDLLDLMPHQQQFAIDAWQRTLDDWEADA